jgi:protein-tyrosine phosphatase
VNASTSLKAMTRTDAAPRWIALEGAVNVRCLGGLPLTGGGAVAPGRLLRSDNLQNLTDRDIARLVDDHRVSNVIDLRTGVEVRLEGPGPLAGDGRVVIEHRSLYPEAGEHTDVLEADAIVPWQDGLRGADLPGETPTVQTYFGYLERRPDSIVAALRTIADPPGGGAALVHCAAGKDRTGLVVGLALSAVGAEPDVVAGDYALTQSRLFALVEDYLAGIEDEAQREEIRGYQATPAAYLLRVLEHLDDRYGGAAAYLRSGGMTDEQLSALRRRLVA